MATLIKTDIAEKLYEDRALQLSKLDAQHLVDSFFHLLTESFIAGCDVKLSGFGNFCVRYKKARPGRNPKTGEEVLIEPRRVVTFRAGQKLKKRVNYPASVSSTTSNAFSTDVCVQSPEEA